MKNKQFLRRTVLFLAILMSGGMLIIPRMPLFAIIIVLTYASPWQKRFNHGLIFAMAISILILAIELFRPSPLDFVQLITRAANFGVGILLTNMYSNLGSDTLKSDLFSITNLFPIQAIATTVLATVIPGLFIQIPGIEVRSFLLLFNYNPAFSELSHGIMRPNGLFWEPGILQFYLNINLYLALFIFNNRMSAFLTMLAIICTQSTTGIIIMLLLLLFFLVAKFNKKYIFSTIIALFLLTPFGLYGYRNILYKTEGEARGSFIARQYDAITGFNIAVKYPWLGIGFNLSTYQAKALELGYITPDFDNNYTEDRGGNTNGVIYLMYSIGMPLGFLFLTSMLRQNYFENQIAFSLVLILSLLSESIIFTPFILMIIFNGMFFRKSFAIRDKLPR